MPGSRDELSIGRQHGPRAAETTPFAPQATLGRSNLFQRLCDIAKEGLWVYDHQLRVSIVNRSLAEMLGYSTGEMIGRDIHDFYEDRYFHTLNGAQARRRQGVTESYEVELRGKDGAPVPAMVSATPIYDTDGQYAGAAAMILNLTKQRRAEEEAHRDKERLAMMSRATKDVFFECNLTSGVGNGRLWFSQAIAEVLGHGTYRAELQWWRDRVHPDDLDRLDAIMRDVITRGIDAAAAEYRLRRGDGSYADVVTRGYLIRSDKGDAVRVIGTITDVTERNAGATAAAETHKRLQALFDNALDAIVLVNDDGFFIDANPSGTALFGYSREEIIRMHFTALTPPPSDDEARRHWLDFQREGRRVSEFIVRRKDGRMVNIEYCAVRDIQPGVHLVVIRDITERKQFERNLAENQLLLEALSTRMVQAQEDERTRIARELHDEIGQTLTAVTLGMDAIARIAGGSRVPGMVEEMHLAIDRALERVHEISLGLRPLLLDDLGLAATLRWYLDGQAQKAGLVIKFNPVTTADRFARVVETACFRVVQEAVTNVIRHARANQAWVDLIVQVDQLVLTVKDDGRGFDAAKQMAERTSSLGLAGMAERVRLLGGTFDILSQPRHGTTIRVTFPRPVEEKEA